MVVAVVAVFQGIDFNNQGLSLQTVLKDAGVSDTFENDQKRRDFILFKFKEVNTLQNELSELEYQNTSLLQYKVQKDSLKSLVDSCLQVLNKNQRSFYSKISNLREKIVFYSGSINLKFRVEEKREVFVLLMDIFEILGGVEESSESILAVQTAYERFEKRHGLFKENELMITEYETTLLVRDYLNKIHPIN